MRRRTDKTTREQPELPADFSAALQGFRTEATNLGINRQKIGAVLGWIESLASRPTPLTPTEDLGDEWVTQRVLRDTIWAVAAHGSESASRTLAGLVELSDRFGDPAFTRLVACDLRDANAILRHDTPYVAKSINAWLDRRDLRCTGNDGGDLSESAQVSGVWLAGDRMDHRQLCPALIGAFVGHTPIVIEFDGSYRRSAITVQHLPSDGAADPGAWVTDLGSELTGWLSPTGRWTPAMSAGTAVQHIDGSLSQTVSLPDARSATAHADVVAITAAKDRTRVEQSQADFRFAKRAYLEA